MKYFLPLIYFLAIISGCGRADEVNMLADRVFSLAKTQYAQMDEALGNGQFPKCTDSEGNLVTSDAGWWCSGFYPGSYGIYISIPETRLSGI